MQRGRRSTHDEERNWTARLGPREASTQTSAGAALPAAPRQHGGVGIGARAQKSSVCGSADGQDGSRKVFWGLGPVEAAVKSISLGFPHNMAG
jgi:hypothetical protein